MKSKIVKLLLIIVLIFTLLFSFNYINNVKADSGWDSDYDSSWDSGSDWGGSSWDNDYDYDSDDDDWGSSSSSGSSDPILIPIMFFPVVVIFALMLLFSSNGKNIDNGRAQRRKEYLHQKTSKINYHKELTQEEANKVIPNFDIKEFNFNAYQIFYNVQMAWMNFDYAKLKELLTDELYNSYVMQLDSLKLKKQKNTMSGFELLNSHMISLKEENGKYIAKVYLNVKFYDYIENSDNGLVLRGTAHKKLNNIYILTFIRTKEEHKDINMCPRCSAPVEGNSTGICEYCKSKLINETHDWVMSKKEKISQR